MPTATPSETARIPRLLWGYVLSRAFLALIGAYMLFSVLLYATTGIDICIPCLWSTIFGVHCPGCGLTTAAIELVRLDIAGAWKANPLIFIVIPAGIYFAWKDFSQFVSKTQAAQAAA